MAKDLILALILAHQVQIWATSFFFENLAPSDTRYHGQLSLCAMSEKTNYSIFRKFNDGRRSAQRTDKRTRVISQDAKRLTSSVPNGARDFQDSRSFERSACFYVIIIGFFERLKQIFQKMKTFFQKTGVQFFS